MKNTFPAILKTGFLLWISILTGSSLLAQSPVYRDSQYTHQINKAGLTEGIRLVLDLPSPISAATVDTAYLKLSADLGENYTYGNIGFRAEVVFSIVAEGATTQPVCISPCRLTLTNNYPESLYFADISPWVNQDRIALRVDSIRVNVTHSNATIKASLEAQIHTDLRLQLSYTIGYGIDVGGVVLNTGTVLMKDKVATFHWNATFAPNCEFQLVRLYNGLDPNKNGVDANLKAKLLSGKSIVTAIDWGQALTIETQSSRNSLSLTLAEGSGYYAWRVRPIGTAYPGGIANGKNHGGWSNGKLSVAKEINTQSAPAIIPTDDFAKPLPVFYFTDPDEDINSIYSRTFTEGNRVSEKISYASSLQQLKQTQTYLPSQKTQITSQTIYDFSNRPAMTTLPVPKADSLGLTGYKSQFVKPANANNRPYVAGDFDADSTINRPARINQQVTEFNYYSGKNNVADAEGYPMSRTRYYNDGSNRVREQSGVGKRHMIGDTAAGMGRTVKSYYGTASETELIRLFGDEAPQGESVLKTITEDQNNTATITYTSKEGKVIATSMAFQTQGRLLPVSDSDEQTTIITDRVTTNQLNGTVIVSNKRLAIIERTPLDITYRMDTCSSSLQDCNKISADCRYELLVRVHKIDGERFSTRSSSRNYLAMEANSSRKAWQFASADSTMLISVATPVSCRGQAELIFNRITLPPGTYMVEKELLPKGGEIVVEQAGEKINAQIRPLSNMIKSWLSTATCDKNIINFYADLRQLARDVDSVKALCRTNTASCQNTFAGLDARYRSKGLVADTFFTADHAVVVFPATGTPQKVILSSACCQNLTIPLDYAPTFDFDRIALVEKSGLPNPGSAGSYYTVNPFLFIDDRKTEFYPDFEGYAFGYFWNCTPAGSELDNAISGLTIPPSVYQGDLSVYDTDPAMTHAQKVAQLGTDRKKITFIYHRILKPYLSGWDTPGTFNLMAHKMLTNQYSCDGVNQDRPTPGNDPCSGSSVALPCNGRGECVHYHARDLFNCWVNQLGYLKDNLNLCPDPTGAAFYDEEQGEPPYKVSDGMDKENKGDDTVHDNHIDGNIQGGNFLTKWFAKRKVKKVAKRIRKMQGAPDPDGEGGDVGASEKLAPSFKYHIINEFLECTGYRFAKILTNALPGDTEPLASDKENGMSYQVPAPATANGTAYRGINRGYTPDANWKAVAYGDTANLFPYSKDPVYAFKYFEYKDESRPEVEFSTCYRDPNICYDTQGNPVPCCPTETDNLCNFCGVGKVRCDLTKKDWNCGQRYTFYTMLKNYQESEPINWADDGLVCDDFTAPGYVEADTFYTWENNQVYTSDQYETLRQSNFVVANKRLKTRVELEMERLNRGLGTACENKRDMYRQSLVDLFLKKGYVLGGCKTSPTDNIVPWADVDTLVNIIIGQCKQRGMVTTFTCLGDSCRDMYTSKYIAGHVDKSGERIEFNRLEFGVEEAGATTCTEAVVYYRPSLNSTTLTAGNTTLTASASYGNSTLTIRRCNGDTFTYCEWTKRREVTEMVLKIDIPPYQNLTYQTPCQTNPGPDCPGSPTRNPTIVNNSALDPKAPVQYLEKKKSSAVGVRVKIKTDNSVEVQSPNQ